MTTISPFHAYVAQHHARDFSKRILSTNRSTSEMLTVVDEMTTDILTALAADIYDEAPYEDALGILTMLDDEVEDFVSQFLHLFSKHDNAIFDWMDHYDIQNITTEPDDFDDTLVALERTDLVKEIFSELRWIARNFVNSLHQ